MRLLIGCSSLIAFVAFIIGFVVSLFISDVTWTERLAMGAMPAVMAFVAALLLFVRDSVRRSVRMRSVRRHLLSCSNTSDKQFIASRKTGETVLLLETRKAIASYFDVPTTKVDRNVHLIHELHVDKLEPSFQFFVVNAVIATQPVEPKPFSFTTAGHESIDDFVLEIRKVLDGFEHHR